MHGFLRVGGGIDDSVAYVNHLLVAVEANL